MSEKGIKSTSLVGHYGLGNMMDCISDRLFHKQAGKGCLSVRVLFNFLQDVRPRARIWSLERVASNARRLTSLSTRHICDGNLNGGSRSLGNGSLSFGCARLT